MAVHEGVTPPTLEVILSSLDQNDDIPERRILVNTRDPIIIGRSSRNLTKGIMEASHNAFIDSPVVSREHAVLSASESRTGPEVYIMDNKSMHGTKVNNIFLSRDHPRRLHNGDKLQFGVDVVRETDTFLARQFRFTARPVPAPAAEEPLFPRGVSAPSAMSTEDEDSEEDDEDEPVHNSPRPRYGSQANPVNLDDFEDERANIITLLDDDEDEEDDEGDVDDDSLYDYDSMHDDGPSSPKLQNNEFSDHAGSSSLPSLSVEPFDDARSFSSIEDAVDLNSNHRISRSDVSEYRSHSRSQHSDLFQASDFPDISEPEQQADLNLSHGKVSKLDELVTQDKLRAKHTRLEESTTHPLASDNDSALFGTAHPFSQWPSDSPASPFVSNTPNSWSAQHPEVSFDSGFPGFNGFWRKDPGPYYSPAFEAAQNVTVGIKSTYDFKPQVQYTAQYPPTFAKFDSFKSPDSPVAASAQNISSPPTPYSEDQAPPTPRQRTRVSICELVDAPSAEKAAEEAPLAPTENAKETSFPPTENAKEKSFPPTENITETPLPPTEIAAITQLPPTENESERLPSTKVAKEAPATASSLKRKADVLDAEAQDAFNPKVSDDGDISSSKIPQFREPRVDETSLSPSQVQVQRPRKKLRRRALNYAGSVAAAVAVGAAAMVGALAALPDGFFE